MGIAPASPLLDGRHRPGERLVEVDALRGLAAFAVVFYHYLDRHEETLGHAGDPLFWAPWAGYGVQLFFVISGFVIFMTLDRTQRPLDFVVSRFARLYPVYWAALLITVGVVLLTDIDYFRPTLREVLVNLTMWQALLMVRDVEGAYWTLYVELCFYAVMLALFAARQLRHIEAWALAGLAAAWLFWWGQVIHGEHGWSWTLFELFGRVIPEIPFFVIGISLYRLYRGVRSRDAVLLMLLALVTVAVQKGRIDTAAALIAVTAFALILLQRARWLRWWPLTGLGAISYSLYLVHNYAGRALLERLEQEGWPVNVSVAATILLAVACATALTFLIERPAQRRILRWYRQRRTVPHAAGAT